MAPNTISTFTKRRGTSNRRIRIAAGTVVLLLSIALGVAFSNHRSVSATDAVWNARQSAHAEFDAGSVPAPELTRECRFRPGLLGLRARVEIYWSLPAGYTLDDVEVHASTSGLGSVLAPLTGFSLSGQTSGSPNEYTTSVPTNLLGGLLGLGSELEIGFFVNDETWSSTPASVATNAGLLAGLGGNCRNLT